MPYYCWAGVEVLALFLKRMAQENSLCREKIIKEWTLEICNKQ